MGGLECMFAGDVVPDFVDVVQREVRPVNPHCREFASVRLRGRLPCLHWRLVGSGPASSGRERVHDIISAGGFRQVVDQFARDLFRGLHGGTPRER